MPWVGGEGEGAKRFYLDIRHPRALYEEAPEGEGAPGGALLRGGGQEQGGVTGHVHLGGGHCTQ
jgi:hypothetical protein